ncbi:DUF6691 family protein [Propionivibrio sp.]|uniref:DUF6691 family protein n=1 Tax=Propionivibrio sp. TaxID=2212460 RepID=UPI003BF04DB8
MNKKSLAMLIFLLVGTIVGAGFTLGGMTDPGNVVGFLDFSPGWRPLLLGVLGGAVTVTLIGFQAAKRIKKPWLEDSFPNLSNSTIDKKLIFGSAAFGLGWGLVGYCPGPAIATIVMGNTEGMLFLLSMVVGGLTYQFSNHLLKP